MELPSIDLAIAV